METFAEFEQDLHEALAHLYDPDYKPPATVCQVLDCTASQDGAVFRAGLIQAIEGMKPGPDVPAHGSGWRLYQLLSDRYLHGLTQDATAKRLGITTRHLQREQKRAIHLLAERLWQASQQMGQFSEQGNDAPAEAGSWKSQVQQALSLLQQDEAEPIANLATTVEGVVKIGEVLASAHGLALRVQPLPPDVAVNIHPSALRQILLTAIEKLAPIVESGDIVIAGQRAAAQVELVIRGAVGRQTTLPQSELIGEILRVTKGRFTIGREEEEIVFRVWLPLVKTAVAVLVVDDNADLVHFFRLYTADTPYHITHLSAGEQLLEQIPIIKPNIIVLDVLLPGQDGWELLTYLRSHVETRSIPVIVCSVVKREELALTLGAALYLPKPVRRRQFVRALDEVWERVVG
ncbi:MAG: response regulator [Chloroflexota bacterium]